MPDSLTPSPMLAAQARAQEQADATGVVWVVLAINRRNTDPLWLADRETSVHPGRLGASDCVWSTHRPTTAGA